MIFYTTLRVLLEKIINIENKVVMNKSIFTQYF